MYTKSPICTFNHSYPITSILTLLLSPIHSFRFIVNPTANSMEACFYEPDSPVPWDDIDCVIVPHKSPQNDLHIASHGHTPGQGSILTPGGPCPICLRELRIPRMTKCGHLFWYVIYAVRAVSCTRLTRT